MFGTRHSLCFNHACVHHILQTRDGHRGFSNVSGEHNLTATLGEEGGGTPDIRLLTDCTLNRTSAVQYSGVQYSGIWECTHKTKDVYMLLYFWSRSNILYVCMVRTYGSSRVPSLLV